MLVLLDDVILGNREEARVLGIWNELSGLPGGIERVIGATVASRGEKRVGVGGPLGRKLSHCLTGGVKRGLSLGRKLVRAVGRCMISASETGLPSNPYPTGSVERSTSTVPAMA